MKRMVTLFAVLAIAATVTYGQTSNVYSRNAVGYVKVTVDRGNLVLMQVPFETLDGSDPTVTDLFGTDNLPAGTTVYYWDANAQQYRSEDFIGNPLFIWDPGTNLFPRGEGFFLQIPDDAPDTQYTVLAMGEVPDRFTAPTSTVQLIEGLEMISYGYPTEIALTASVLNAIANAGDTIYYWNESTQQYQSEDFIGFPLNVWDPGTLVLQPGRTYFYRTTNAQEWAEDKPYDWP